MKRRNDPTRTELADELVRIAMAALELSTAIRAGIGGDLDIQAGDLCRRMSAARDDVVLIMPAKSPRRSSAPTSEDE